MDALRRVLAAWWRSLPGTVLLYGSLLTHFALALVSLARRRTLRMPAWEACQLALGLCVLPLLAYHVDRHALRLAAARPRGELPAHRRRDLGRSRGRSRSRSR